MIIGIGPNCPKKMTPKSDRLLLNYSNRLGIKRQSVFAFKLVLFVSQEKKTPSPFSHPRSRV